MKENGPIPDYPLRERRINGITVPEIPFGIRESYWKAGLVIFAVLLMLVTVLTLMAGVQPDTVGYLYVIPAIL